MPPDFPVTYSNTTATAQSLYVPVFAPPAPTVRSLPKCRRCGVRTVAREYQTCNVCTGRGRR